MLLGEAGHVYRLAMDIHLDVGVAVVLAGILGLDVELGRRCVLRSLDRSRKRKRVRLYRMWPVSTSKGGRAQAVLRELRLTTRCGREVRAKLRGQGGRRATGSFGTLPMLLPPLSHAG